MGIRDALTGQSVRPAVFLDRDGVINRAVVKEGRPYPPETPEELEILPGVYEALECLKRAGYLLVVLTNQPDVARGKTGKAVVEEMNSLLSSTLPLDDVFVCYHDDADRCDCRKPLPGLFYRARDKHGITLARSFMVGDRWRDIEAGKAAGCRTIYIDCGYREQRPGSEPTFRCRTLKEATEWILESR